MAKTKRATVESLLGKKHRERVLELKGSGETVLFRAIGSKEYDDLIAAHPPSKKDKDDGAVWNPDTFAPALISACSVEPSIPVDVAQEIWSSPMWSRGELMDLFTAVVRLNAEGLDVPFTESG